MSLHNAAMKSLRLNNGTTSPHTMEPVLMTIDLITEILSWLPVESLVRFKCVSRSWNSLISNPTFVKFHFHRSSRHHNLLLTLQPVIYNVTSNPLTLQPVFNRVSSNRFVMFGSKHDLLKNQPLSTIVSAQEGRILLKPKYSVIGSCNGLVCLSGFSHGNTQQYWIRFWNPAMQLRSKKSPRFSINQDNRSLLCPVFGFGNDESSDTYKVVVVFGSRLGLDYMRTKEMRAMVYTMGGDSWRDIQGFPGFFSPDMVATMGSFLSGTLNWIAYRRYSYQLIIVSLDLGKETFGQLLLPEVLDEGPRLSLPPNLFSLANILDEVAKILPTLGVLMDCLCVSHDDKKTSHFVVWQMKMFGDEKSWTQIVNVCYQHLQIDMSLSKWAKWAMFPLCMSENGDVLVLKDVARHGTLIYNRRDNTVHTNISWSGQTDGKDGTIIGFFDYVQSLVLPC